MSRLLRLTWLRFCNLIKIAQPVRIPLRDKALAVAGRVSVLKVRDSMQVCCPVCLEAISAPVESDVKMILAVHLSLWHPEDVKLQWDIMQNKNDSFLHLPSLILGVGIAAGVVVLLASLAKNQAQALVGNTARQPRFKLR